MSEVLKLKLDIPTKIDGPLRPSVKLDVEAISTGGEVFSFEQESEIILSSKNKSHELSFVTDEDEDLLQDFTIKLMDDGYLCLQSNSGTVTDVWVKVGSVK